MNHIDPRERLLALGNELLDLAYQEHEIRPRMLKLQKLTSMVNDESDIDSVSQDVKDMFGGNGADAIVFAIEAVALSDKRQQKLEQYCMLRSTIEAMEQPRQEAPGEGENPLSNAHSRACGIIPHPHGNACSNNCPTCGGIE